MTPALPPLALTMGDPGGVGGEIAVSAWRRLSPGALAGGPRFFAIDAPERLRRLGAAVAEIDAPADAEAVLFSRALPVLPLDLPEPPPPGTADPSTAAATLDAIEQAVRAAMNGDASGVVTNPINKALLKDGARFPFPGHTEFLAHLTGAPRPVMLLAGDMLRVVPLTIHIPLKDAPATIAAALLTDTIRILDAALRRDFGVPSPRISVAGLNPHAGENGVLGREEIEVIAPALEGLRAEGYRLSGPRSADTMFHPEARAMYDAAVTMYHDQGLIPIKTLEFDRGVNVTLGLPIIRTSPDHGVAYDIAGKGVARADSLVAAIERAWAMAQARRSMTAAAAGA